MSERITKYKSVFTVLSVVLLSFATIGYFRAYDRYRFEAVSQETIGALDEHYTVITGRRKLPRYKVQYSFKNGDQVLRGKDTIRERPASRVVTVYFDPTNPEKNSLIRREARGQLLAAVFLTGLGLFTLLLRRAVS
jgi:hypothetical protein